MSLPSSGRGRLAAAGLRVACGLPGGASRDENCGIFAACTAVGGTEFWAAAGVMVAISNPAITDRKIVRNDEPRSCSVLCIGLSSCHAAQEEGGIPEKIGARVPLGGRQVRR